MAKDLDLHAEADPHGVVLFTPFGSVYRLVIGTVPYAAELDGHSRGVRQHLMLDANEVRSNLERIKAMLDRLA